MSLETVNCATGTFDALKGRIAGGVIPGGPYAWYLLRHAFRPGRLAVVTQSPGFYPSGAVFTYLAAARLPFIRLLHLSVFAPLEDTVARLNEFQPEFVTGYASALEDLAREQAAGRLRLRELTGLTSTSEPLNPIARESIEGAFGVKVADCYMLAECLALTTGCPVTQSL